MSNFIQYLIALGTPQETLIYILMLPLVATLITFARQVIGIKGFGMFSPLLLIFAFVISGLKYGLIILGVVLITGSLIRLVLKGRRLMYLPRIALVLALVTVVILAMLTVGGLLGQRNFLQVSILPLLIIIALVEEFVAVQLKMRLKMATILTLETLALAIIGYFLVSWPFLQSLVLVYPFWILGLALVINWLLGKWTGLRLTELYRFRRVIAQGKT